MKQMMIVFALIFAVAFSAGAQNLADSRETSEHRTARLAHLKHDTAVAKQQMEAAQQQALAEASTKTSAREAFSLRCDNPLFVAFYGPNGVRTICDVNDDGRADLIGRFYELPKISGNSVTALASSRNGRTLFAATDFGSIIRLTDTNSRGFADDKPIENPGLAQTERLLPLADGPSTLIYSENSQSGRFNLYRLDQASTSVQGGDLPRGALRIAGSIATRDAILTIDANQDVVRRVAFNPIGFLDNSEARNYVLYRGSHITSITVDETNNLLFVLEVPDCTMPTPQPPSTTGRAGGAVSCSAPVIRVIRYFDNTSVEIASFAPSDLNVFYNFSGHSMIARNGKLYIVVQSPGNNGHRILEARYDQKTGNLVRPATVFADFDLLGEWAYIGSLAFFDGGPVLQQVAQ